MSCIYQNDFSQKLHERLVKNTKGFYKKDSDNCLQLDLENIELDGDSTIFNAAYTTAYTNYITKYEQFLREYDTAVADINAADGEDAVDVAVADKKAKLEGIINDSSVGNIHEFVNTSYNNFDDHFNFESTTDSSDITATIKPESDLAKVGINLIDAHTPLLGNDNDVNAKFKTNYKDYVAADGEYKDAYKQLKMNEQLVFVFLLSSISLGLLLHYNN